MATEETIRKNKLKQKLFARDGWYKDFGSGVGMWEALCAFGCGTVLIFETATLDHYPIMESQGGRLILKNLRLACSPCNARNCNSFGGRLPSIRRLRKCNNNQIRYLSKLVRGNWIPSGSYQKEQQCSG